LIIQRLYMNSLYGINFSKTYLVYNDAHSP